MVFHNAELMGKVCKSKFDFEIIPHCMVAILDENEFKTGFEFHKCEQIKFNGFNFNDFFFSFSSHISHTASWLPPAECWSHNIEYPYGWEKAIDGKGRPYYIK